MKVVLLNGKWYPNTGGGIVHVDELATRLAEDHNCDVDIIVKESDVDDSFVDTSENVNLIQIPTSISKFRPLNELQYILSILRYVHKGDYDIVHAHTNVTAFPLQLLRIFDDLATILTVHGASLDFEVTYTGSILDSVYTSLRRMLLEKFTYDGIISVSDELADALSEYHRKIEYIPNGVAIDDFPAPENSGSKEILFVGRLRPKKNPVDIVEAMEEVASDHPESALHIVGTGPLEEEIKRTAVASGIEDRVTVHGRVSDEELHDLYQRCSIFVLPSKWEGHPLVLLEAWAAGMIVIGTNVEGIREFLSGKSFGKLVPLNDPNEIASAINSSLAQPTTLNQNGTEARQFVREEYDWDATASQTYDLYKELITNGSKSETEKQGAVR
ncbi:glycosyltransferase family 4 protein [Halococcus sp. PRR34]|uniref:glycosyltransferase family 4 protein n=1 Tax=Halococcus sp. PRR34 TaxID=3020830 RepID=UPI00235E7415|nr:glycosyltransferase family 4 protein [Halococcus sp. PRR34]